MLSMVQLLLNHIYTPLIILKPCQNVTTISLHEAGINTYLEIAFLLLRRVPGTKHHFGNSSTEIQRWPLNSCILSSPNGSTDSSRYTRRGMVTLTLAIIIDTEDMRSSNGYQQGVEAAGLLSYTAQLRLVQTAAYYANGLHVRRRLANYDRRKPKHTTSCMKAWVESEHAVLNVVTRESIHHI